MKDSLRKLLDVWREEVDEDWDERVVDVLDALEQQAAAGEARFAVRRVRSTVITAVLYSAPSLVKVQAPRLVPVVEQAVREEDGRVAADEPLGVALVSLIDLVNALQLAELEISADTITTIRGWLRRIGVERGRDPADYWTVGFAALALDDKQTYRRIAGYTVDDPLPFTPGEHFALNVQATLAHMAAAVERGASRDDVWKAWIHFLSHISELYFARMIGKGTILWAGRVVHHLLGGEPLGEVAVAIDTDLDGVAEELERRG